jgi:uncharacterized protein with ParB-like and HNH nuclease domain
MNNLQKEIDEMSKSIKTDSYPMSIGEIINIYGDGDLIINPEYQRLFRWDISQQSSLIESILLGIPLPPIYVYQTEDGKWNLIDGQQRLSTILKFVGVLKTKDGELIEQEALVRTKFLPSLKGKKWSDGLDEEVLTEAQRRYIKRSKIDIVIIDKGSDKFAQYEMFQRLNTMGSKLSDQEIRNCLLIMNDAESAQYFKELSEYEPFIKSIPISERDQEQQGYMEQVIRYFVIRYSELNIDDSENYNEFLTNEILEIIDEQKIIYEDEKAIFKRTFDLINSVFDEDGFKKYDFTKNKFLGPVLVGAYEAIIPGLTENLDFFGQQENNEKLKGIVKSIYGKTEYNSAIKRGVRPVTRLKRLVEFSKELFRIED